MTAFLSVISAVNEMIPIFTSIFNLYIEAKKNGWIKDGAALREKVQNAKTTEERLNLAQSMFEHRAH